MPMLEWMRGLFHGGSGRTGRAQVDPRTPLEDWLRDAEARRGAGDSAGAVQLCSRILDEDPDHARALCLLGEIAAARGDAGEAEGLFRRALSIVESNPHLHYALGCVLASQGNRAEAEAAYRRALALAPGHADARVNLGCLLQAGGEADAGHAGAQGERATRDLDEAIGHFRAATEIAPDSPDGWINLGYALAQQRRPGEATQAYGRALAIDPELAHARVNRAMALLSQGRWLEAWEDYEWRWQASGFPRPRFSRPEWDGSDPSQKTIFLYTEQGFGDAIQFVRYARLLAERGARVVLRCQPELKTLLATAAGVTNALTVADPEPEFDMHCSLLSLPRLLGTTTETIPGEAPYLFPAGAGAGAAAAGRRLRVGLVWSSQSAFPGAAQKSLPAEALTPLADIPGVDFFSLQLGKVSVPSFARDLTPGIRDFSDTATLIAGLDLTLSVDTAVAHLAGAMGKPVWVLLPYVADWRWEPDGPASKWYPGMRLFRQHRRGDWAEVVARVAEELRGELRGLAGTAATFPTSAGAAGA
ncbi:MAG: tetratricopeptide repeat protein [Burkholderiales bacterium]